jgi:hypothetical protein
LNASATGVIPDLDRAVLEILRQHAVQRARIVGGTGGAAVPVRALRQTVRNRVGERDRLDGQLDDAVSRLGGRRTNSGDASGFPTGFPTGFLSGFLLRLARMVGSSKPGEDVYELPQSVISRPYREPAQLHH